MRITALVALLLGCSAQGILDGQVFTHALFGIGCGAVAVACGSRAARQRRSPRMSLWFLAGGGAALVLICTAMLPSSYRSQIQFNRLIERRIQTGRSKGTANQRFEATATSLSASIGDGDGASVAVPHPRRWAS